MSEVAFERRRVSGEILTESESAAKTGLGGEKNSKRLEGRSGRFLHIDLLESIAIFLVVLFHSTLFTVDLSAADSLPAYFVYYFESIMSVMVPLFFFANGYLLFSRSFSLSKHLRKMIRFIVLCVLWGLVLVPIYMVIKGEAISIRNVVLALLYLESDWNMNIYWFLGVIVSIYVLFPALKTLYDSDIKTFTYVLIALGVLTMGYKFVNELLDLLRSFVGSGPGTVSFPATTILNPLDKTYGYAFVYFCLGGIAFHNEDKLLQISHRKRDAFAFVGLMFSWVLLFLRGVFYSKRVYFETCDQIWSGYDTFYAMAAVLCLYVLSLNYRKESRLITVISCNTLGIYFFHELYIMLTRPSVFEVEALCNPLFNLVYAFLILMISLLQVLLMKKIPGIRKLV